MKKKRFSVEQIVAVLKQTEVGVPVAEVIRKVGISSATGVSISVCFKIATICSTVGLCRKLALKLD